VNQWLTPRKPLAGSNLADMGRCAVRGRTRMGAVNSEAAFRYR
jgi:hypothetical protein